jgi:hypothetical protein
VFAALAVAREAQDRVGLAIRNVIRRFRPLRSATIAVKGAVRALRPASALIGIDMMGETARSFSVSRTCRSAGLGRRDG